MKTEVYSWRVDSKVKAELKRAARDEGTTVSGLLDRLTGEWLEKQNGETDDEAEQRRLHAEAEKFIGMFHGGDPDGSKQVRERVRERLRKRRAR